jgi:hypothetical protein
MPAEAADAQDQRNDQQDTDQAFEPGPVYVGLHIATGKSIFDIRRQPFDIQADDGHTQDQQGDKPPQNRQEDAHIFFIQHFTPPTYR